MNRILVVDDERSLCKALAIGLSLDEFEVDFATNGKTGIRLGNQKTYDILIVDLCLPDINGLEVIREIKRSLPEIIPFVITGNECVESSIEAIRLGVKDYLIKPLDLEKIRDAIIRELKKNVLKREMIRKESYRLFKESISSMVPGFIPQINNPLMSIMENAELADIQWIAEPEKAKAKRKEAGKALRKAIKGTIQVMALTVEYRDPYTASHQRRVTHITCALAKEMGLSEELIEGLHMAALIHDIGKISVPAEILCNPGRLTKNEFGIIKEHPWVGYDLLKIIEFPWPVAQIVYQHHERIDGSGYPLGLSGEEIILESKILAVADSVEAMASHRPYRPALGLDNALNEILRNRGVLYDPDVVDACMTLFSENRNLDAFQLQEEMNNNNIAKLATC